ncbi:Uncharacterized protein FWK35_00018379 [Aphis craccivora]|uniref:Uncharacterized protein n=1 Tax=Aphis craccivora TaxID=307492 RepID=A0A6G0XNH1_APHCR|nr:Uncharacterized protein FWK35_00018379 [Aphis craccivora]
MPIFVKTRVYLITPFRVDTYINISIFFFEIAPLNKILEPGKWVPLCCTLGAVWTTIRSVKFVYNDGYHCIRKTILSGDGLSV